MDGRNPAHYAVITALLRRIAFRVPGAAGELCRIPTKDEFPLHIIKCPGEAGRNSYAVENTCAC